MHAISKIARGHQDNIEEEEDDDDDDDDDDDEEVEKALALATAVNTASTRSNTARNNFK
jgi:hypothetical protein